MKRTEISVDIADFPAPFAPLLQNTRVFDSSCSPQARVYYLEKDGGYFLKVAARGTLAREAAQARYFHTLGLGAAVLDYRTEQGRDWLLTARVAGEDCTHTTYLAHPARLCDLLAQQLRALHEQDFSDCPVPNRSEAYFATAERNYRQGAYDLS